MSERRVRTGNGEDGEAARREHAQDLAHRGAVVRHVLEHVVAEREVEAPGREAQAREVAAHRDVGAREVERDVGVQPERAQPALEAGLRSHVQQAQRGPRERGRLDEEGPDRAMALARVAHGAGGAGPPRPLVGEEGAQVGGADGAVAPPPEVPDPPRREAQRLPPARRDQEPHESAHEPHSGPRLGRSPSSVDAPAALSPGGAGGAMETIRTETVDRVRQIVLCRPEAYNTINPQLRDELSAAIDTADADPDVRVILLRAEGPAFCAGYGLDWSTAAQARERHPAEGPRKAAEATAQRAAGDRGSASRVWDSVSDMRMIGSFVDVYMKLWYARKPTLAAVQGWCIGGGTDMVLC